MISSTTFSCKKDPSWLLANSSIADFKSFLALEGVKFSDSIKSSISLLFELSFSKVFKSTLSEDTLKKLEWSLNYIIH